ncbi:unnamed protein product [Penicillium salamii]|uniref:Uncharacterized protein n=1 Tax=Penicillium salamii TaxID=1612424 RepID=A0A9W4JDC5_9EURO|nr:unnamed protein product [Penicillium salamii]CAG8391259.1 unnamed protein product [Penicillium salamii]CAG8393797.1 unnamed protein product [Penicillium salamii]CAG8408306.1 unnamed protein product [Penicillium salamii]
MSRTHSQQCGPTTSEKPSDPVLRSRQPVRLPMTANPYLQHETQHQVSDMGYESPMLLEPSDLRSTRQFPERFINPNCMPSSDNYFIASQLVPQALPLRMHCHAPNISGSREDPGQATPNPTSSQDREDVGHSVRIDDLGFNSGPAATPSPVHFEERPDSLLNYLAPASAQQKTRLRNPNRRIPHSFDNLLHQDSWLSTPPTTGRESPQRKYYLYI